MIRELFSTFSSFQLFFHISSWLIVVFSMAKIGCLDFSLLCGALLMSLNIGRFVEFCTYSSLVVAAYLRSSGGAIFERTGSHCNFVARTQPDMILIALFNSTSTLFVWTLLCHTGAQYSAVLYTSANADVQSIFALHPQLVSASLLIMLFLVINLFLIPPRCC